MNFASLYSGGKDSNLAIIKALENGHEVSVLVNIRSKNPHSFMFHTPVQDMVDVQAECLEIPLIVEETEGKKEEELVDLENALKRAKDEYGVDGVISGAVRSVYQSKRIEKVAKKLGMVVFKPLWLMDEMSLAKEACEIMDVIISGVAGYPLTENFIGMRLIDVLDYLEKNRVSPSGEGGEFETLVLDSPLFKKRIEIISYETEWENWNGRMKNVKFRLIEK